MAATLDRTFELHAGALRLAVRPDLGGCMSGLWHRDVPVLRSVEPGELTASRPSACYPLVPYSNRLGYRGFRWQGQDYTTAPNFGDNPHSVHGVAWLRAWDVAAFNDAELVLRYEHQPDAHWPFAFDVQQRFTLTPAQLCVQLAFTNTAPVTQPAGLGWHPYFQKRQRSQLQIALSGRWVSDATQLPTHRVAQAGIEGDVSQFDFDHCFDGWRGPAHIRDEQFSLQLSSSLQHLVVYTPRDKDYFCVEPVSHVSDAIHMADPLHHGLVALDPGKTAEAWMKLDVKAS